MHCTNCSAPLPQGAATCPNCGASNPYYSSNPAASPYNPYAPSAQPPPPQPPTAYGAPADPYGYPQSNTPYGQPNNPYPQYPPYGNTVPNQAPYGAPPPAGYGYPQGTPVGTVPALPEQGNYGGIPQPPKRRKSIGLIIGIIILVLVLACGGLIALGAVLANKGKTITTTSTPTTAATPTSASAVPNNGQISAAAATILTNGQTTSKVDSDYLPTQVTQNFTANQTVYLTFNVNSKGNDGYILVKWYLNGQLLTSDKLHHSAQNDHGYFSLPYNEAGQGAAAMYWGTKADLSDAQLALVVNFNVS